MNGSIKLLFEFSEETVRNPRSPWIRTPMVLAIEWSFLLAGIVGDGRGRKRALMVCLSGWNSGRWVGKSDGSSCRTVGLNNDGFGYRTVGDRWERKGIGEKWQSNLKC